MGNKDKKGLIAKKKNIFGRMLPKNAILMSPIFLYFNQFLKYKTE